MLDAEISLQNMVNIIPAKQQVGITTVSKLTTAYVRDVKNCHHLFPRRRCDIFKLIARFIPCGVSFLSSFKTAVFYFESIISSSHV